MRTDPFANLSAVCCLSMNKFTMKARRHFCDTYIYIYVYIIIYIIIYIYVYIYTQVANAEYSVVVHVVYYEM